MTEVKKWKLEDWVAGFINKELPPMTQEEIASAIATLKAEGYPTPEDCPGGRCREYRPACSVGICKIAICLCGDW